LSETGLPTLPERSQTSECLALIARLAIAPPQERPAVALQLARLGSERAVEELERMVELAETGWSEPVTRRVLVSWLPSFFPTSLRKLCGHWKTETFARPVAYGREDQLAAVMALGQSGQARALAYLRRLTGEAKGDPELAAAARAALEHLGRQLGG
jgi:hypothetical protein